MFINQYIVVLSVGLTVTAGLDAATLSGLAAFSGASTVSTPDPPRHADFVDSSDLTPTDPIEPVTTPFWGGTDYTRYADWVSGDTYLTYSNDIAVGAYLGGFSFDAPWEGSSSEVYATYATYGSNHPLERQRPIGESTGGGPGPTSGTPEPGTFLMEFAALSMVSALLIARKKHFGYRW